MVQLEAPIDPVMRRKLEAAIGNLPRKQREIFLANRRDGMTYRAIANATGLTTRKVERYMAKALVHLMKCLDSDDLNRSGSPCQGSRDSQQKIGGERRSVVKYDQDV